MKNVLQVVRGRGHLDEYTYTWIGKYARKHPKEKLYMFNTVDNEQILIFAKNKKELEKSFRQLMAMDEDPLHNDPDNFDDSCYVKLF